MDPDYPLPLPPAPPPIGALPAAHLSIDNLERHTKNQPLSAEKPSNSTPNSPGKDLNTHKEIEDLVKQNEALKRRLAELEGGTQVRHAETPKRGPIAPAEVGGPHSMCCVVS